MGSRGYSLIGQTTGEVANPQVDQAWGGQVAGLRTVEACQHDEAIHLGPEALGDGDRWQAQVDQEEGQADDAGGRPQHPGSF